MKHSRRRTVGAFAAIGSALITSNIASAASERAKGPTFEPQDSWLANAAHRHRMAFDTTTALGLGVGMKYAMNFFHANQNGYNIRADELAVLVILRHSSTSFAFNDRMWAKYGDYFVNRTDIFDPHTMATPRLNLYYAEQKTPNLPNGDITLSKLANLGTRFAVCGMAVSSLAKVIAQNEHQHHAIYQELQSNMIPNATLAAAGILMVNRAQEHGYTLSYCG